MSAPHNCATQGKGRGRGAPALHNNKGRGAPAPHEKQILRYFALWLGWEPWDGFTGPDA